MGRPPLPLAKRYGCLEVIQRIPQSNPASASVRCTACGANHTYQVQNLRLFKGVFCRSCPDSVRISVNPRSAGPVPTWYVVMGEYVRVFHAQDPWLFLQPDEAAHARLYRGNSGRAAYVPTATITPESSLPVRSPAFRVTRDVYDSAFAKNDPYALSQAFPGLEPALKTWITSNPAPPSWSCSPLSRNEVWLYPDPQPQTSPAQEPFDPYGP